MSARVWNGTTAVLADDVYVVQPGGGYSRAPIMRALPYGSLSVQDMLAEEPFYWAHRGGSKIFPEMSMYAYTRAAWHGVHALEISVARTSDGVYFGLHDQTLDRTSQITGNVNPQSLTWAQVQQYQIFPPSAASPEIPAQPYCRLEDFLEVYGQSHVIVLDPKYVSQAQGPSLISLAKQFMPSSRLIGKYFYDSAGWANIFRTAGVASWGYAYDEQALDSAKLALWDLLGLNWSASEAHWAALVATGKPCVAHIVDAVSQVQRTQALGAVGFQCSDPLTVVPQEDDR
jgi:glycerophosphoryl diester phosphodiesterase